MTNLLTSISFESPNELPDYSGTSVLLTPAYPLSYSTFIVAATDSLRMYESPTSSLDESPLSALGDSSIQGSFDTDVDSSLFDFVMGAEGQQFDILRSI